MRIRPITRAVCWLLILLFTVQTTGCHSWKVTPQPWPSVAGKKAPDRYRITRSDGVRFEAQLVKASGDTLYATGRQAVPMDAAQGNRWVATPFSEVLRLEERHAATGATVALVGTIVLVLVGLSYIAMHETAVAIGGMLKSAIR